MHMLTEQKQPKLFCAYIAKSRKPSFSSLHKAEACSIFYKAEACFQSEIC